MKMKQSMGSLMARVWTSGYALETVPACLAARSSTTFREGHAPCLTIALGSHVHPPTNRRLSF